MTPEVSPKQAGLGLRAALPFWISLGLVPMVWLGALFGGWWLAAPVLATWVLFSVLDGALGLETANLDPETPDRFLTWHRAVTLIWVPVQAVSLLALLAFVPQASHLGLFDKLAVFFGAGVMTGSIGINYAHELMHQTNRVERWLADLLLSMVLYSHFRSEHLLVHHRYVGTPRDAVTARYNEGFHRFFFRVLPECAISAFQAEAALLARKSLPWHSRRNPFWRYAALQGGMVVLAVLLGGWLGLALFGFQAFVAVWQLELVNYVEHYGLTRRLVGEDKYEPVRPHHSWNASQKATNWLLINLQRHSDHHYKPDRRFPLLQNYDPDEAPQLPFGYPLMTAAAMVPPIWRRIMNPRVRAWREKYYPSEIAPETAEVT